MFKSQCLQVPAPGIGPSVLVNINQEVVSSDGTFAELNTEYCDNVTGTRHVFVTCDICGRSGIIGMRWHCTQCHDYDLCQECYMSDKHDLTHAFVRYDTPMSVG